MGRFAGLLFSPLAHGNFVDDISFGIIFLFMAGVFVYFYFTGADGTDEPGTGE
jgi:hypothetical protein